MTTTLPQAPLPAATPFTQPNSFDIPGDPLSIRDSAAAYWAFSDAAIALAVRVETVDTSQWQGSEGQAFLASTAVVPGVLRQTSAAFTGVAQALLRFAEALAHAQRTARRLGEHHASAAGRLRAVNADLLEARRLDPGSEQVLAPLTAQAHVLQADMSGLSQRATALREEVEAAARVCAALIDTTGAPPIAPIRPEPVYGKGVPAPVPPRSLDLMSQAEIRSWWTGLTPQQRQAAAASAPALYGNLPGIPAADRHWINQITLDAELRAGEQMFAQAGLPAPTSAAEVAALDEASLVALGVLERVYGKDGTQSYRPGPDPERESAVERYAGALAVRDQVAPPVATDEPAMVYGYEPFLFEGRGRAILSLGDPETADNVAVLVPGLTSRTASMDGAGARNLRRQADTEDGREETAVVTWQGYDSPQLPSSSTTYGAEGVAVGGQSKADEGGLRLATDVAALAAARRGLPLPAVIGHSYGSTTVGIALQRYGMAPYVRDVALIGSPGIGGDARGASDLGLRKDQLFVGSASKDKVTTVFGVHGTDPALAEAGGTRFRAEAPDRGDGFISDHNKYLDTEGGRPSDSLETLGLVAADRTEEVGSRDLLAEPRRVEARGNGTYPALVTVDPEQTRQPSGIQ